MKLRVGQLGARRFSGVDLGALPAGGLGATKDPTVLWVSAQLEHVDFLGTQNQQAEMRQGSILVGMNDWKRKTAITGLARCRPGEADAYWLARA
jgi:hypothetical protein